MNITRRDFALTGLVASAVAALPGTGAAAVAPVKAKDSLWFVNSQLQPAARQLQAMMAQFKPPSDAMLPVMRQHALPAPAPLDNVPVARKIIAGRAGNPDVTIYIVNGKAGGQRPGIVHMHGGGFIMGGASGGIRDLQDIATAVDCVIVTVEYRLAPETRYSGSIEDNYAALRFLHDNAEANGVDKARLAVMGESAGGGHAAILAITARDRGEVPLAFQCLVYPMLDDRTGSARSVPSPIGTLLWTAEQNRFAWSSFLGQKAGAASAPANAVPARLTDLTGLPPAFIGVGSIDLFVREDIDYAGRLIEAGVPTQLLVVPGAFHGFDVIARDAGITKDFNAAKLDALRKALSLSTSGEPRVG